MQSRAFVVIAAQRAECATVALGGSDRHGQRAGERRCALGCHLAREVQILADAVLLPRDSGDAGEQLVVDQREVADRLDVHPMMLAVGHFDRAGIVALRLDRNEANRAAQAVLAEQCALRSVQHFHPLDIRQVHRGTGHRAVVDVIEVHRNGRLERVAEIDLRNAAQSDRLGRTVVADGRPEVSVWNLESQIVDVRHLALAQICRAQSSDRERSLLQVLLSIARGDDHLG